MRAGIAAYSLVLRMGSRARRRAETRRAISFHRSARGSGYASRHDREPGRSRAARTSTHGDVLTAISDGMVALLKEYYGRGPTRTKTYFEDDLVVCLMRAGSRAWSRRSSRAGAAQR